MKYTVKPRAISARQYFLKGYNDAQAIFLAFADLMDVDKDMGLRMFSSLGAGFGRLREICGALSATELVLGALYGYSSPDAFEEKAAHYKRVQEIAKRFEEVAGSIICRDLLGLNGASIPVPDRRTSKYYDVRPCANLVALAAGILEDYIDNHPY